MNKDPSKKFRPSNLVEITINKEKIKARIMPRPETFDSGLITAKLESGYNIGLNKRDIKNIKLISKDSEEKQARGKIMKKGGYPLISIIHTGGTVASKVDYKTGGVVSSFEPEDILDMFPELENIANIKSRLLFQMFSEDMEPDHWLILAKEIENEINKLNPKGIIITHGTDTLAYTAVALSFMLQDLPIPVILVGSQRSVDRPSSDAAVNLICAAQFIIQTKFTGVGVCMHGASSDDYCLIHQATKVRKMHTSRRDAFRVIDVFPYAHVFPDGKVEFLREDYPKKENQKLKTFIGFNNNVAMIYVRPGFNYKELMLYKKYKGIILVGTGPMAVDYAKVLKALKCKFLA
ncbi:Glu-tRNA(Gln) amidotransferase subunit GatD, partial [Candidatus Woesearchaeota archaeon]|nr:Glu-tRNA(Gln) amidotransferase subunit GatD [Candidatus Woesearchaeota archaeon]